MSRVRQKVAEEPGSAAASPRKTRSLSSSDLIAPATQLAGSGTSPDMSETPLGRRKSSDDGLARSKGALETEGSKPNK